MNIDSIKTGFVIDHIEAGKAMPLYRLLKLNELECSVAMIMNVTSKKLGKKDIIKIDDDIDINLDAIGFIDPNATVNIIRDGVLAEKKTIPMPRELTNILRCKNPRCISSTEQELPQRFRLADEANKIYRCVYCDSKNSDYIK